MEIKSVKKISMIGFLLIILSFFFDELTAEIIARLHTPGMVSFMYFITDFGVIFLCALILAVCIIKKKYRFLIFMSVTGIIAFEAAFLMKLIFEVPRPYLLDYTDPVFTASGYAFPSIHTAFLCSLLPYFKYLYKKPALIVMYVFISMIIISRVYLGVHTLSDIVAGGLIGLIATYSLLAYEKKYHFITWFESQVTDKLELRRQTAHLILGGLIVFLLKLHLLNAYILFAITLAGGVLVLVARKIRLPLIHRILEHFERPHHMARFPGRGSFFLFLGASLAVFIFEKDIAMAAIMILAVGDSVTNIAGRYFGKIRNPFNEKKQLEGTIIAIILSTLAAMIFVPIEHAFLASTVAMGLESLNLGWKKRSLEFDDNVMIPLAAGVIMTIL